MCRGRWPDLHPARTSRRAYAARGRQRTLQMSGRRARAYRRWLGSPSTGSSQLLPIPGELLPRPGLRRYGAARTGLAERGRTGVRGRGHGRTGPPRALSTLTCDVTARTRPHVKIRAVSPGVEQRPQLRCLGGLSLQRAPPGPLDASAGQPPAASARRLRLADIRVTRHRVATSRSLAPFSNHSPAASRTRS